MRDTRATPYRLGTCLLFTQRMMVDRDRASIFPPSLTNDLMVVQRNYEIRQLNSIHHGRGRGRGRRSVKKCLVTPLSLSSSLMCPYGSCVLCTNFCYCRKRHVACRAARLQFLVPTRRNVSQLRSERRSNNSIYITSKLCHLKAEIFHILDSSVN